MMRAAPPPAGGASSERHRSIRHCPPDEPAATAAGLAGHGSGARGGVAGRRPPLPALRLQPPRPGRAALPRVRVPLRVGATAGPEAPAPPVPVRAPPEAKRLVVRQNPRRRAAAPAVLGEAAPRPALPAGEA